MKDNAEYFSHDADMRNDIKVRALRRAFGCKGYAVWCFLLETLTDSEEFELPYTDIDKELLAADFDVSVEELKDIVAQCLRLGLLDVTDDGARIFSVAHKRRLASVVALKEKRSRAGKAGMLSRWGSARDNKEPQSDCTLITSDNSAENVITENSKGKETKPNETRGKERKYPYGEVVALWNEICGEGAGLPKVVGLNDNRRQKIRCRLSEFSSSEGELLEKTRDLFRRVAGSDFLRGGNGWTATFDWLFANPTNWVKVTEGNYDNDRRGVTRGKQAQPLTQQPVTVANGGETTPVTLGIGERIDTATGLRTYGSGRVVIPFDAPPRPSERHSWDAGTGAWILL